MSLCAIVEVQQKIFLLTLFIPNVGQSKKGLNLRKGDFYSEPVYQQVIRFAESCLSRSAR